MALPAIKRSISGFLSFKLSDLKKKHIIPLLIFIAAFLLGATGSFFYLTHYNTALILQTNTKKDIYIEFANEVYDKIQANYWDKISDEQLVNLYKLAAEKVSGKPQNLKIPSGKPGPIPTNEPGLSINLQGSSVSDIKALNLPRSATQADNYKRGLDAMLSEDLAGLDSKDKKKEFITQVTGAVLANLQPFGRSGLYNSQQEQALKNTVQNITGQDRYGDLGLKKGASQAEIKQSYQAKVDNLSKQTTATAQAQLKKVEEAYNTLKSPDIQKRYDTTGIETTIVSKKLSNNIAYLRLKKFSPTTYDDLHKAAQSLDTQNGPEDLILDLRGNIGGAIDSVPYFMGDFLGKNQYAYDFFHQGDYTPFKTATDKFQPLARYKQVVVLTDGASQSSAEVMASIFKKYHLGVLVGTHTHGWGSVEQVFPLQNQLDPNDKYSVFLVHSLTISDDNQPIEGRGVIPNVDTSNANWKSELFGYFHNSELNDAVEGMLKQPLQD